MIKGKTLEEAAEITNEDIAEELDGLPREKMHCSVMGREALEAAMIDHYQRLGRGVPCHLLQQETLLCHCFQVTKDTVRDAIFNHRLEDVEDVTNFTKAGGGCGDCHHDIGDLLRDCWDKIERGEAPEPKPDPGLVQLGEMPRGTCRRMRSGRRGYRDQDPGTSGRGHLGGPAQRRRRHRIRALPRGQGLSSG